MVDHQNHMLDNKVDSLIDRIGAARGSSSPSSDSDDENLSKITPKVSILFGRMQPVHGVLGGGKPADVLLWKNKKVSGGVLVVATATWVLFEVMEYHLLTVICNGLILGLAFVFLWSNANTFIKKSPPRIPDIQIPEDPVLEIASVLRIQTNRAFAVLRDIVSRRDAKKFLTVISGLWIISIVGSWCDFFTLLYTVTLLALSVPLIYDKYEDQIDYFMEKAMDELKKKYAEFDAKVLSKFPRSPSKDKKSE